MTNNELIAELEQFDDGCTVRVHGDRLRIYDFTRNINDAFIGEIDPGWYAAEMGDLD